MTAKLSLRVFKDLRGIATQEGAVTNVYALDAHGERDPSRDHRDLVIPAGSEATPLSLDVEAGAYVVEAMLPSGQTTTQQVHVGEGAKVALDLEAPHSPREWLSWQQYIGNVPARPEEREPRKSTPQKQRRVRTTAGRVSSRSRVMYNSAPGGRGGALRVGGGSLRTITGWDGPATAWESMGGGGALAIDEAVEETRTRPPKLPPAPVVWFLDDPVTGLRGERQGAAAWSLLGKQAAARDPFAVLARGLPTRSTRSPDSDPQRAFYSFGVAGRTTDPARDRGSGDYVPRRYLVSVQTGGPIEIACLPVPWESGPYGRVPIEVLVRRQPNAGEAVLAMSPADPLTRSAIGYMGSGNLVNARLVFDRAKGMLFGKMMNPLSAAAGAYVLLATEHGPGEHEWHGWVKNLADRFKWLPDGQIQYGRLRLNRRQKEGDVKAARAAFFEAFERGIPFYSLGLKWLLEGLSLLAVAGDEDARKRLAAVQEVTWRANLQQPFTTIRLRQK